MSARRAHPGVRIGLALAALCVALAQPARAFEPKPQLPPIDYAAIGSKLFDVVVLRPLGAGSTVIGCAAFLIAAPLAAPSMGIGPVLERFVTTPFDFTFRRALGDF
jgi:hypothetical protein